MLDVGVSQLNYHCSKMMNEKQTKLMQCIMYSCHCHCQSTVHRLCLIYFIENANETSMSQNVCKDEQKETTQNEKEAEKKTFYNFVMQ